ncbi:MAG TPA: hypothetical protein P5545_05905 [Bacteroidota bacterium]|nr:hypothetical protein [Bacteroidota bacterium]
MKRFITTIFILLFCFTYLIAFSQEYESQIEEIFDNSSGNPYSENEIEYIEYRRINKLNLFEASKSDLTKFPAFDIITANKIINYLKNNSNTNIAKLSKDLNLTTEQEIILDNCCILNKSISKGFMLDSRTRNNFQFDKIYGFENQKFQGNKLEYSQKIISAFNNYEMGIVLDKDAGELNFVDFYSSYLKYDNNKTKLIIGDYYIELGLGNILARDFPTRKGSNIIAPALNFGGGIRPSRSSLDYSFFRGIGIEQKFNLVTNKLNMKFSIAGSNTAKSGNVDTIAGIISSYYLTGLYRTQTEIAKKDKINEKSLFCSIEAQLSNLLFGIGTIYLDYNYPIQSSSSSAFQGKNGFLKSVWLEYLRENLSIGSEASLDAHNNFAMKIGSIIDFKDFKLAFHLRSFSENYRAPYGSIFGEFSNPANEIGLYSGVIFKVNKQWLLSGFLDLYKSYGHTYYVPAIVRGFNTFLESNYKISYDISLLNRFVYENKTDNIKINSIDNIYQKKKYSLRNDIIYRYSESFYTRFRFEGVIINYAGFQNQEYGAVGFAEFNYIPKNNLKLFARISYFSTDSYDAAIWEYEYFISSMMTTFPAYLDGCRYLFGLKYNIFSHYNISLLYTNTSKNNLKELSSGNDKILNNYSNNLIFQLEIKY